jgi:hypothetical protein
VRTTAITDAIVADAVRIVRTDFKDGTLIFHLNHHVPEVWQNAVGRVSGPYSMGAHPRMVRFAGAVAYIPAGPGQEDSVKRYAEQWFDRANQFYADELKEAARRREREERHRLQAEREAERYRNEVLKRLNP